MTPDASPFKIFPARLPMAPVLAELHKACFAAPWDTKAMGDLLSMPGGLAFVIGRSAGPPAGFVMVNRAADQADILTIGILPRQRRRRLGRQLMQHVSDQLRSLGVREIFLEVAADNAAAISLYKACGYIEIGRRKNYYAPNGRDRTAVQMKCNLNG